MPLCLLSISILFKQNAKQQYTKFASIDYQLLWNYLNNYATKIIMVSGCLPKAMCRG